MRILYVITSLGVGGAEVVTINLANYFSNKGNQVGLVYLTGKNLHVDKIVPSVQVWGLEMKKTPLGVLKAQKDMKKIVKEFIPDVVHSHMFHANLFMRILRWHTNIKYLINTEHTKNVEGKSRMLFYRLTDCWSEVNTNVSKESTDFFIEQKAFRKENSLAVYNGVNTLHFSANPHQKDIRKELGIEDGTFVFLNVGRLMPPKDQFNLINAFERINTVLSKSVLLIVGGGDLFAKLQQQIINKNLEERVFLLGERKDVRNLYACADCFVLSSAWEGFPMVLIEAMAMGLPIVTTECGKEAVQRMDYVVPIRDAKGLADKMIQIAHLSFAERERISIQNKELVKKFDMDCICEIWFELYSRGIAKKNL